MTPFELDILLHYYSCAGDHPVVQNNPPIWSETREMFLKYGLLSIATEGTATYKRTERLTVYIDHICSLPLPVQEWRMP